MEYPGVHHHADNDLLEYVVFDDAQRTRYHAIHLRSGRHAASYMSKLSMGPVSYIDEYGEQRCKAQYAVRKICGMSWRGKPG